MTAPLILVADDEEPILRLVGYALEDAGYRVVAAVDGAEALRLARELLPAVAILDVRMPGLDGHEVARALRGDLRTTGMPIVMLTALAADEDVVAGLTAGADDYVRKPFSLADLARRVEALVPPG